MSKFIAVIGPSGVGKSHCCGAAAAELGIQFTDLDTAIGEASGAGIGEFFAQAHRRGPSVFFQFGKDLCAEERAKSDGKHVLVAIGAGSIDYASRDAAAVADWLRRGFDSVICVVDDPKNAVKRDPVKRSLSAYKASEYNEARKALYDIAALRHDVAGRDKTASARAFIELLKGALIDAGV